jgi:hypothetical protein
MGNGFDIESVRVASPTTIEIAVSVQANAQPGERDIFVKNANPGGGEVLLRGAFAVHNPPPSAESMVPSSGRSGTTMLVTIKGRGFLQGETRLILGEGIEVDSLAVKNSAEMEARLSIRTGLLAGLRSVTVSNPAPGGGTAKLPDGFTVFGPVVDLVRSVGAEVPDRPVLIGAHPNPFNHAVTLTYGVPDLCVVRLVVRNILGVQIAEVSNGLRNAGYHSIRWESRNVPSGIYFVQMIAESGKLNGRFTASARLILLK